MATLASRAQSLAPCAALVLLAACARGGQDEMSWARAALERNGQIEVVASDAQTRTFTVRVKGTGEVRIVRVDQLVGDPSAASASAPALAATPAAAPVGEETREVTAATAASAAPPAANDASAAAPASPPAPASQASGAHVLETGPGYSIEAASGAQSARLQSGPGYSIKPAVGAAVASSSSRPRVRDAGVTSAAVERRREPIICQGSRLLHIDNRNLEFDGDAVSAEDGCEIHITNSHISATGIGVLARHANVHIDNSLIEGDAGSIDASEGAQVYAEDSRFIGLSRRLDSSTFHDLGGNIWN
jgi:hypothetical protein